MRSLILDVTAFHIACDIPVLPKPTVPSAGRKWLRRKLIEEEVNQELLPALRRDDLVDIADGIADAIYVLVGTALEYGIPLDAVWNAVQRANMAKIDSTTGKATHRADGKVLKPEGWTPPDIKAVLDQCR